jgi:hypothetical protein
LYNFNAFSLSLPLKGTGRTRFNFGNPALIDRGGRFLYKYQNTGRDSAQADQYSSIGIRSLVARWWNGNYYVLEGFESSWERVYEFAFRLLVLLFIAFQVGS